ncbi:MAG TPA: YceD family protein [Burkholderiales bacterium]|nr:YceD family protein [Burkholderiales bacterium]
MFDRAVVDSVAFARESGALRATVAVAALERLHDALFERSGAITYELAGRVDQDGKPSLRLELGGDLLLRCQRCLGPVSFRFDAVRNFVLVPAGQALSDSADEAEDTEHLYADPRLDVIALVEDEVILGLPMVPGHEEGVCEVTSPQAESVRQASPFNALAALKRQ